jgi:hypothetical protein
MNDMEEKILNSYKRDYESEKASYRILGQMLDEDFVRKRIKFFGIEHMYIYGGTYMAIQLYRASCNYIDVKGIVDKSSKLVGKDDIRVFNLDEFKGIYYDEKIIVTPIIYYSSIRDDLKTFIDIDNIICIAELMEGML